MEEAHQGSRFICCHSTEICCSQGLEDQFRGPRDINKSIPKSIKRLRIHERIMRNYVDLYERAMFAPRGSHEYKFLGDWLKFMMKTGSEQRFSTTATASYSIESSRVLMRSRQVWCEARAISDMGSDSICVLEDWGVWKRERFRDPQFII
jgi:hypothetical protein